jgi:hypothetical protein
MTRAPFAICCALVVLLLGCATTTPQSFEGTSGNIAWRVTDLRIEERDAGPPGRGGRTVTWRYSIVLKETQGTGVTFNTIDSSYARPANLRVARKTDAVNLKLPPGGELRVNAWDSDWLVTPQGTEGTAQSRNPNGTATRVFTGTSDKGQPVKLTIAYPPYSIPPSAPARPPSTAATKRAEAPKPPAAGEPAPTPSKPAEAKGASDPLPLGFFTKEPPPPGKVYRSDGSDYPARVQVFDADADARVVFFYLVKTETRVFRLRTDWYDPAGALFETFTRTVDFTRGTTWSSFYTANVLQTEQMRDYPGTWTVKLTVDTQAAGEYRFDLRSASAASRPRPTVTAERPPSPTPGQRWILSVGVLELDRIEGGVYVYKLGGDQEYHRNRDGHLSRVRVGGENVITYDPPFPYFQWPLEVGKRWFYDGQVTNKLTGLKGRSRSTIHVLAYEDVDTPAGRLKTFRISTGNSTYWYSPEVGAVVKYITTGPSTVGDYTLVARNADGRPSASAAVARPAAPDGRPLRPEDLRPYYGDSWAVVIGIDRYPAAAQIPRLNYAVADARSVAAMLPSLGFAPDRITVLENAQATKMGVEQALYGSLTSMGNDDRLFVFFAGHGVSHPIKGGSEGYLLTADASLDNLPLTALAMRDLAQIGRRLPAKHIVFILDTCFSGFATSRDVITPRPGAPDLLSLTREPVVQVLTAGSQDQRVFEDKGHGIFTKHLLKGLEGWADLEGTGLTTVKLAAYIQERVLRDSGGAQTPQYGKLDGEGEFLFRPPRP